MKKIYKYENGVFLARMQPLHIAHMFLVEEAMRECKNVYVFLGSANKKDMLRNPFSIEFRRQMLDEALEEQGYSEYDRRRVEVFEIPDWSYENDTNEESTWGRYFYYNVVSRIQSKRFSIYYSDNPATLDRWFDSEVGEYITPVTYDRSNTFDGLSATKVRDAIINKDLTYLDKYVPKPVIRNLDFISEYYKNVRENPDSDFAMK